MGTDLFVEQGGLFGHLVSRFSTHPENLATEALTFILNRSATMREELRNLFGRTGIELPPLARFPSAEAAPIHICNPNSKLLAGFNSPNTSAASRTVMPWRNAQKA